MKKTLFIFVFIFIIRLLSAQVLWDEPRLLGSLTNYTKNFTIDLGNDQVMTGWNEYLADTGTFKYEIQKFNAQCQPLSPIPVPVITQQNAFIMKDMIRQDDFIYYFGRIFNSEINQVQIILQKTDLNGNYLFEPQGRILNVFHENLNLLNVSFYSNHFNILCVTQTGETNNLIHYEIDLNGNILHSSNILNTSVSLESSCLYSMSNDTPYYLIYGEETYLVKYNCERHRLILDTNYDFPSSGYISDFIMKNNMIIYSYHENDTNIWKLICQSDQTIVWEKTFEVSGFINNCLIEPVNEENLIFALADKVYRITLTGYECWIYQLPDPISKIWIRNNELFSLTSKWQSPKFILKTDLTNGDSQILHQLNNTIYDINDFIYTDNYLIGPNFISYHHAIASHNLLSLSLEIPDQMYNYQLHKQYLAPIIIRQSDSFYHYFTSDNSKFICYNNDFSYQSINHNLYFIHEFGLSNCFYYNEMNDQFIYHTTNNNKYVPFIKTHENDLIVQRNPWYDIPVNLVLLEEGQFPVDSLIITDSIIPNYHYYQINSFSDDESTYILINKYGMDHFYFNKIQNHHFVYSIDEKQLFLNDAVCAISKHYILSENYNSGYYLTKIDDNGNIDPQWPSPSLFLENNYFYKCQINETEQGCLIFYLIKNTDDTYSVRIQYISNTGVSLLPQQYIELVNNINDPEIYFLPKDNYFFLITPEVNQNTKTFSMQKYQTDNSLTPLWDNPIILIEEADALTDGYFWNALEYCKILDDKIFVLFNKNNIFYAKTFDLNGNTNNLQNGAIIDRGFGDKIMLNVISLQDHNYYIIYEIVNAFENQIFLQKINLANLLSSDNPEVTPQVLSLKNYPNPFNPSTTLEFSTNHTGPAELKIFNIKGQLVKTLLQSNLEKGNHKLIWNGDNNQKQNCSSGIYFVRLKSGEQSILKKIMLMK